MSQLFVINMTTPEIEIIHYGNRHEVLMSIDIGQRNMAVVIFRTGRIVSLKLMSVYESRMNTKTLAKNIIDMVESLVKEYDKIGYCLVEKQLPFILGNGYNQSPRINSSIELALHVAFGYGHIETITYAKPRANKKTSYVERKRTAVQHVQQLIQDRKGLFEQGVIDEFESCSKKDAYADAILMIFNHLRILE
jgi:hypothetical protein